MNAVWQWIKNKAGRITTAVGGFLAGVQVFDLSLVKQPLVDFVGDHWATKLVSGAALLCFLLSYWRHQHVANVVGK